MDMEINFPNLGIYLDHVGKSISIFGFIRFGGVSNSFYKIENTAIGLAV